MENGDERIRALFGAPVDEIISSQSQRTKQKEVPTPTSINFLFWRFVMILGAETSKRILGQRNYPPKPRRPPAQSRRLIMQFIFHDRTLRGVLFLNIQRRQQS